jgi:hypothetical protein
MIFFRPPVSPERDPIMGTALLVFVSGTVLAPFICSLF